MKCKICKSTSNLVRTFKTVSKKGDSYTYYGCAVCFPPRKILTPQERVEAKRKNENKYRKGNPEFLRKKRERYKNDFLYQKKAKARASVNNKLRAGIKRPKKCVLCNATVKIQAHHPDHNKPLQVIWLCFECHHRHHAGVIKNRDIKKHKTSV